MRVIEDEGKAIDYREAVITMSTKNMVPSSQVLTRLNILKIISGYFDFSSKMKREFFFNLLKKSKFLFANTYKKFIIIVY